MQETFSKKTFCRYSWFLKVLGNKWKLDINLNLCLIFDISYPKNHLFLSKIIYFSGSAKRLIFNFASGKHSFYTRDNRFLLSQYSFECPTYVCLFSKNRTSWNFFNFGGSVNFKNSWIEVISFPIVYYIHKWERGWYTNMYCKENRYN